MAIQSKERAVAELEAEASDAARDAMAREALAEARASRASELAAQVEEAKAKVEEAERASGRRKAVIAELEGERESCERAAINLLDAAQELLTGREPHGIEAVVQVLRAMLEGRTGAAAAPSERLEGTTGLLRLAELLRAGGAG